MIYMDSHKLTIIIQLYTDHLKHLQNIKIKLNIIYIYLKYNILQKILQKIYTKKIV